MHCGKCTKNCSSLVASSYSRSLPASLHCPISHVVIFSSVTPGTLGHAEKAQGKGSGCWEVLGDGAGGQWKLGSLTSLGNSPGVVTSVVGACVCVQMQNVEKS